MLNKTVFVLLLLTCSAPVFSQTGGQWVYCSGEALVQNMSNEEAQVIARRRARLDAIEKVCGVNLQSETLVHNFVMAGDFIHSISYGNVVEEKDLSWNYEMIQADDPASPPVMVLRLTMNARVVTVEEKPDPYFTLNVNLNRTVFQAGEEVILSVKSSQDCYITVLNLASNDSVYILFPNRIRKDNFIPANTKIEIPEKIDRDAGLRFRVANFAGHKIDTELVKVVATKQKLLFVNDVNTTGGFGLMGTPKVAVTKLAGWLSGIPISERAEATVMYTVNSGK